MFAESFDIPVYDEPLRSLIENAYADAYAHHGDLGLAAPDYSASVISIAKRCHRGAEYSSELAVFIAQLHTSDLYLSIACAFHHDRAWQRFELLYRKYMCDLVTYLC